MSTFSYNLRFLVLNVFVVLALFALPTLVNAQANPEMNYQGKLTNSAGVAVPDGLYNMKYWLIGSSTAATSTALWSEVRTSGDRVQVTNGLFSVMLGEVSSLTGVDFNQTLYLGVEVGGLSTTTPVCCCTTNNLRCRICKLNCCCNGTGTASSQCQKINIGC